MAQFTGEPNHDNSSVSVQASYGWEYLIQPTAIEDSYLEWMKDEREMAAMMSLYPSTPAGTTLDDYNLGYRAYTTSIGVPGSTEHSSPAKAIPLEMPDGFDIEPPFLLGTSPISGALDSINVHQTAVNADTTLQLPPTAAELSVERHRSAGLSPGDMGSGT